MRTAAWTLCSLCALAACKPNTFEAYRKTAPIRVHERPDNYEQSNFGAQLVTLQTQLAGQPVASIFASAGAGSPVAIMRAWTGTHVTEASAESRCHQAGECPGGSDIGSALIPFPTWAANTAVAKDNCVFAPSNSTLPWADDDSRLGGEAFVLCENDATVHFAMSEAFLAARNGTGSMVFTGFGLPAGHPLGVVIYGAYARDNKSGEKRGGDVYVQQDFDMNTGKAPLALPLPLIDPDTLTRFGADGRGGDLGAQVVGSVQNGKGLLLAVSQPSQQRVLVASYDDTAPGMPIDRFALRACIKTPDPSLRGFGERLVLGDVTGDGVPELFVGVDPVNGVQKGKQALYMYLGNGLPEPASGGCSDWGSAAVEVSCDDAGGLSCEGSGFGAALAVGDVDADGKGDLIVGAPLTEVDGVSEAGALWLLPGSPSGLSADRTAVLTAGKRAQSAHLGTAVATLPTKDRVEPVASAPGQDDVYVFMCSPLEQGYGAASLCLPR